MLELDLTSNQTAVVPLGMPKKCVGARSRPAMRARAAAAHEEPGGHAWQPGSWWAWPNTVVPLSCGSKIFRQTPWRACDLELRGRATWLDRNQPGR
jgi:hypothetical protein